jgi:glycosyltransferase involved in cell wall biosynthesis
VRFGIIYKWYYLIVKKMSQKVLFITPSLFKGGAETQLLKVASFLKAQQKEVMIISLKPVNYFDTDLKREGINVVLLKKWAGNFFSNCFTLFKTVRAFNADVVVAFMFVAIIFARLLKIWFRFKLISTIRISVINRKWFLPFKLTSNLDDIVVYNSIASKASFERRKLVNKNGLVINNSITIPVIAAKNIESENVKTFAWVCVAHFKYNKDYLTLFKAINLLKDENIILDVVGNLHGETWPLIFIQKHQLQHKINLLGQKNPTEYLEKADAFVLSSFSEGMPNALLEAMASSKPIVVSDIACNVAVVNDAKCGLVFEQGNEFDLAEKMRSIMAITQQERIELGQHGKAHIVHNFSEDKVMNDWLTVVNDVNKFQLSSI